VLDLGITAWKYHRVVSAGDQRLLSLDWIRIELFVMSPQAFLFDLVLSIILLDTGTKALRLETDIFPQDHIVN